LNPKNLGVARRPQLRFLTIAIAIAACFALPASASATPAAQIAFTSGPAEAETVTTDSVAIGFNYTGPDVLTGYSCSLDGAPATSCTSAASLTGLANGVHSFSVFASAMGSTMMCFPAPPACMMMPFPYSTSTITRNFTVAVPAVIVPEPDPVIPAPEPDMTAPTASVLSGPVEGARIKSGATKFGVAGESGSTLVCSLDGAPAVACGPTFTTGKLKAGLHKLVITATDPSGNTTSVTRQFRVLVCKKIRARDSKGNVLKTGSGAIKYKTAC
jgi:hypothetical protein